MKKAKMILAVCCLTLSAAAYAQHVQERPTCNAPYPAGNLRPAAPAEQSGDPLRNTNATQEQRDKVWTLIHKYEAQRDKATSKAKEKHQKAESARRSADTKAQEKLKAEVRKVLTPDQYNQFLRNQIYTHVQRADRPKGRRGFGHHPSQLKKRAFCDSVRRNCRPAKCYDKKRAFCDSARRNCRPADCPVKNCAQADCPALNCTTECPEPSCDLKQAPKAEGYVAPATKGPEPILMTGKQGQKK